MLQATIFLADSIGIDVIAEGVETEDQRQILLELGCEAMQGFLFARPLSANDVHATLCAGKIPIGEKAQDSDLE